MTGYYTLIDKLKTILEVEPFINTITKGGIDQVDLDLQAKVECHMLLLNGFRDNKRVVF